MQPNHLHDILTLRYRKVIFVILPLMYIAGVIGLQIPFTQELFKSLSPFNLWISLALLLLFQEEYNRKFIVFSLIVFSTGFFVEVLGVKTGVIFGEYVYGKTLGFKIFDVPLTIGANWLTLIYCTGICSDKITAFLSKHVHTGFSANMFASVSGSFLMTALDVLIEPVAVRLDFWHWKDGIIPVQNYIAWFVISFILYLYFNKSRFSKTNALALRLLLLEVLFFSAHTLAFDLLS